MEQQNPLDSWIFSALLVAAAILAPLLVRWWRNATARRRPRSISLGGTDAPLILTMYSIGVVLQEVSKGTLLTYPYRLSMTSPVPLPNISEDYGLTSEGELDRPQPIELPVGVVRSPIGQSVLSITIPTKSAVHFAGFSLKDPVFRSLLGNTTLDNSMMQVELEGDFPDYFKLYCGSGKQIELLEVLDPPRMAFLIDFCARFNWELFEDTLYFVQSDRSHHTSGGITMVQAATQFAEKILPVLVRMTP